MDDRSDDIPNNSQNDGFPAFVIKRVFIAMVFIAAVITVLAVGIDYLETSDFIPQQAAQNKAQPPAIIIPAAKPPALATASAVQLQFEPAQPDADVPAPPLTALPPPPEKEASGWLDLFKRVPPEQSTKRLDAPMPEQSIEAPRPIEAPVQERSVQSGSQAGGTAPSAPSRQPAPTPSPALRPPGVAFVEAVIKPMDHELNHRFWGWRPNDIVNLTDDVNNSQLGILEVTRRTVVHLAERISRTGYNDAFDRNLENAMNWLMIKPTSYWFPSPETKYKESLSELENYRQNLVNKKAYFHTRSENLIPLLAAFEDLLGSCDTNLVKTKEADGSKVGFTKADDYFFYAKGVSSAMGTILESVSIDFAPILSNRNAAELLHKAINSCRMASSLDPWIITNGSLDGIFANHRAHMAAPISHARYYLGQLIKTLAT